jgi:hypothetical protein
MWMGRRFAVAVVSQGGLMGSALVPRQIPAQSGPTCLKPVRPFEYTRTLWGIGDGLLEDTVQTMVESSEGVLWIVTMGGLTRFDGHQTFEAGALGYLIQEYAA